MRALVEPVLLAELEPVVARLADRHAGMATEWFPHEYVPWDEGQSYATLPWAVEQSHLDPAVRNALEVNLLTEDNLPSYHAANVAAFGLDGAWGWWLHRWTAEENRHSTVLRDYLMVTRGVDPVRLERERMATMQAGYTAPEKDALRSVAYVAFQELATRIAHRNTGLRSQDPVCDRILARIAADENLHMVFYRDLMGAALELTPSQAVAAVAEEVLAFRMPGTGIPDYGARSRQIAHVGIFTLRILVQEVLRPTLARWGFFRMGGLSADAERARDHVGTHLARLERSALRFEEMRSARRVGSTCGARTVPW